MNKKIFAALASATMALSATGSLAVFAEDFDVVDETGNNGNVSGSVTPAATKVYWNKENFGITKATGYDKDGKAVQAQPDSDGLLYLTKNQCESIVKMEYTTDADGVVKGMENFPNLEYFISSNNGVTSVDLSKNEKLKEVNITNADNLATLDLPTTNTLTAITLTATAKRAPISELDLTGNKALGTVTVNNTDIANLDVSSNPYLTVVDVANNKINTLNLNNSLKLAKVIANSNNLYSLDVPQTTTLTELKVANNILQELNVTGLTELQTLEVQDNELRTLDLSKNSSLATLNVTRNHLGFLNVSKTYGVDITNQYQYVYVSKEANSVNLPDNFDGLDEDKVTAVPDATSYDKKKGELTLPDEGYQEYNYNAGNGQVLKVFVTKADLLNRLYNPNSGEHFYTKDTNEKDVLVDLGWHDEGIGWVSPITSGAPVYRLYNPNAGDHHYTKSSKERDTLVSVGWKAEGIGWYSYEGYSDTNPYEKLVPTPAAVDVYREYNPNAKAAGAHNYTMNVAENDFLVSVGWLEEGVAWKAIK